MNTSSRLVPFSIIAVSVWAAVTMYVMHRFPIDGCKFDQSLLEITALGSFIFSIACASVVMTVQFLVRRLKRPVLKLMTLIAALGVSVLVSNLAVGLAAQAVLDTSLPLLDHQTGMQTCLAWFTPDFLNGQAALFRALMLSFIFSFFGSLMLLRRARRGGHPADLRQ